MIEQNLLKLGLNATEIKVYLYLHQHGGSTANKISSETKITRTNVYDTLNKLIKKGMVSFIIKNDVKWFEAESYNSVFAFAKQKENELKEATKKIYEDFKSINHYIEKDRKPLEAKIYVGKKGLRTIFEEMLTLRKPISVMGSRLQFREVLGPYQELWHKRRMKKNILERAIFSKRVKMKIESFKNKIKVHSKKDLYQIKFVDDKIISPTGTFIYGNNCVFIQWSDEPIAIKIHNNKITESHCNHFNTLWNSQA